MTRGLALSRALRKELVPPQFTHGPYQWGVVENINTGPPSVDLYLDGTQTLSDTAYLTKGVRYLSDYRPTVGDVVLVARGTGGLKTDRVVIQRLAVATDAFPAASVTIGTTAGPPTTGTWAAGQEWLDTNDVLYVCTVAGTPGTWVRTGPGIAQAGNNGQQGFTSTVYIPFNPSLSVVTGTLVLVILTSNLQNSGAGNGTYMSFGVSGASTVSPTDTAAIWYVAPTANDQGQYSGVFPLGGLTPGTNTFQVQARVNGGSGYIENTQLIVVPLT